MNKCLKIIGECFSPNPDYSDILKIKHHWYLLKAAREILFKIMNEESKIPLYKGGWFEFWGKKRPLKTK